MPTLTVTESVPHEPLSMDEARPSRRPHRITSLQLESSPVPSEENEGGAFNVGSIGCRMCAVPVKLHWSLFMSVPLWLFMFMQTWSMTFVEWVWGASLVLVLVLSLLLHECGHALALHLCGMRTQCIVLHALGGVTIPANALESTRRFNDNHWVAIFNFVAGPLVNFLLFAMFFVLRDVMAGLGYEEGEMVDFWRGSDVSLWLLYSGFINLVLGVYNLLPIFPLDGGHIFFHLFSQCMPEHWARYATTGITTIVAAAVVMVEAMALQMGDGSIISLSLVSLICMAAILLSVASSYDSYTEFKRRARATVSVNTPPQQAAESDQFESYLDSMEMGVPGDRSSLSSVTSLQVR